MKYKTTVNNIEIELTKEQIKELIKNNPELLEDTKVSGRYFFPNKGGEYYFINGTGFVRPYKNDDECDLETIELGVYKTEEEALLARDKQRAIVACWKWAQENAPFEPDWKNEGEDKYSAYYDFHSEQLYCSNEIYSKRQFTLPYFKSKEDCIKFIEANKANLELLFTK